MRVVAYTGGVNLPSARLRVRQYVEPLRQHGLNLVERTLPLGSAMPKNPLPRALWGVGTLAHRLGTVPVSYFGDLTVIQRQMLPGYLSLQPLLKGPCVLDVDDAIWLSRGGHRVAALAKSCRAVICGNEYLKDYFQQWNKNVRLLPTPVDTDLVKPSAVPFSERNNAVIGWTGTSENYPFLYGIQTALGRVLREHPAARLLIVSDKPPAFTEIPAARLEFVKWSPAAEAEALARMTVGIMPLEDTPWSHGKCSFKMLCYMAAGIPVVATPVGMNRDVLQMGEIGYGPANDSEWIEALDRLLRDGEESMRLGANARNLAVEKFSLKVLSKRLAGYLFEIKGAAAEHYAETLC